MQLYNNNNIVKHGNFLKNKNKSKKQKSTGDLKLEENPKKKCYFQKKKKKKIRTFQSIISLHIQILQL